MEIQELDKKQLVLVTLLITFVVSIATGIVTVSLMQQVPKSVPQMINNVIERTIEKVTTVQVPTAPIIRETSPNNKDTALLLSSGDEALVSIYSLDEVKITTPPSITNSSSSSTVTNTIQSVTASNASDASVGTTDSVKIGDTTKPYIPKALGQGVIISDIGLVLVDSSILTDRDVYGVILNKIDFDATVLKKFANGFSILKISVKKIPETPSVDNKI